MKRTRPIVAIDGPVGAGKSTVARELARAIGFTYLNTGAMYRAVAIALREAGLTDADSPGFESRIAPILGSIRIRFEGERVMLNHRDVSQEITRPEISDLASRFSTIAAVRSRMRDLQRIAGEAGGVVMEGRDIGTAVFPDAEFKFYLDADAVIRARRRYNELTAKEVTADFEEVLRQLRERDERDSARALAPLKRADDAILIDTSGLSISEVVTKLKELMQANLPVVGT